MILELLENPHTDIISALERKLDDTPVSFAEDSRVQNAAHVLRTTEYDMGTGIANIYNHICFLDDTWVLAYLLDCIGAKQAAANARHNYLQSYDPFKATNPVTRGFAYCDALETADSIDDLKFVYASMRSHIGRKSDPILRRMYPLLISVYKARKRHLHKRDSIEVQLVRRITGFLDEGDAHAAERNLAEATQEYKKAADIACQLHDEVLADMMHNRLKGLKGDMSKESYCRNAIERFGTDSERGRLYDRVMRGITHVLPKKA